MATLQELIEYSKANPTSDIAKKTRKAIESGIYDEEANNSGIDLSWAGRPTTTATPNANMTTMPAEEEKDFLSKTGPSFKADLGGAESILPNLTKVAGNIPSSARDIARMSIAPVNPFDIESPVNIGKNIVESVIASRDILRNRGVVDGTKDVLGGFADTYLKLGEKIYGGLEKAYNALLDDPGKALTDVGTDIAKIGIEDPLFIPTLLYGGKKTGAIKTDVISTVARPVTKTAGNIAQKVIKETGDLAVDLKNVATATKRKLVEALPDKAKMRSIFTNIDEQVFRRLENNDKTSRLRSGSYPAEVKSAIETLETGTKNPYINLAQDVSDRITSLSDDAKIKFSETAKSYVEKGEKFDVGARIKEVFDSVDSFKTGKDIKFIEARDRSGKITGYKLKKGRYSPFSSSEISNLNELIGDIRSARNISSDELIALDQKFSTYYRRVSDAAGATPYHVAVMELKEATENRIRNLLSGELKDAYTYYSNVSDLKINLGNKIIGPDGVVKDTAEQFLANINNLNKGALQNKINNYSNILDMDLVASSQAISDAKKLMLTQAPTSGRVKDMLMTYGFGGLGAGFGSMVGMPVVGAVGGAAAGMKLTSPKFVGARAIQEALSNTKPIAEIKIPNIR